MVEIFVPNIITDSIAENEFCSKDSRAKGIFSSQILKAGSSDCHYLLCVQLLVKESTASRRSKQNCTPKNGYNSKCYVMYIFSTIKNA